MDLPESNEAELIAFAAQIFAVVDAIQTSLEQLPPRKDWPVPAEWPETQAMLQIAADDLMICAGVDRVVQELKKNQSLLQILEVLMTNVQGEAFQKTIETAFASRPLGSPTLPGQAFAMYLLAAIDGPEPEWYKE